MYISSNRLKRYIRNSDRIDFISMWNKFTIHSAEIDGIEIKGNDINKVVVAKVKTVEDHPGSDRLHLVTVDAGTGEDLSIVCGAPNLSVGMYVPCALIGGSLKGLPKVERIKLRGVYSNGVLASEKELGISDNHTGIMELDKSYQIGEDIKKYIPIDDIVVEIDNKSLTNRPDMWGHYGIAREVAAITGSELLPLDIYDEIEELKSLNVKVEDTVNCNRYSCIEIGNIKAREASIEMKVFLYYCGMRSVSLLVDLTNYLMLELGTPMHAFDSNKISSIIVKNTGDNELDFTTLDNIKRTIPKNTLMIYNESEPIAIAGIMGGLNSEVEDDTNSIILESANFDATSVRKSATALGLRTEASSRYEKSLDPNLTVLAIKRFIYLLKAHDNDIVINSRIEDVYPNVLNKSVVTLTKEMLKKYIDAPLDDDQVKSILNSLSFEVEVNDNEYIVTAPTYRSTKDITNAADIIEEIARIYGYDNLEPKPLKLDLVAPISDQKYELEYSIKKYIATNTKLSEVHTYLWYQNDVLNKYKIDKSNNLKIANKSDNSILRDDLSLSLFEICLENSKYTNEYGIFEIGSCIKGEDEERVLSILDVCSNQNVSEHYQNLKQLIYNLIKTLRNKEVEFVPAKTSKSYLQEDYTLYILLDNEVIGYISIIDKKLSRDCNKKAEIINVELYQEKLLTIDKESIKYIEPSKYPITNIDYTIILNKEELYGNLEQILNKYEHKYLFNYRLIDTYMDDVKKITIRFNIGSYDKTLTGDEITSFQNDLINYIKENGYNIVDKK
ncbi:MAG TPA: phenylalanine--tRNA ligase subunit beta [Mollicutes bacterium]|nr:phenylalanine--tRNA ligase subunit beta [Mollicutes bacterium]